ncbi:MAG: DUF1318 domain-containing protein [Deltaproteobacteria bacterium]|nr:DUF1318 domain-containing protein [Deltaproteobacteria bacterium]
MRHATSLVILLLTLLVWTGGVHASDIKARMTARLPVINALKTQGLIGENNQGYLEFRSGQRPHADVIAAENQDRKTVYAAIAARQNASVDLVGQTRAAQIASSEPTGFWVQEPSGAWKKK